MKDYSIEKKIYYHDTDCGGVVYYANYLKYFEEGRSEYFFNKGVSLKELSLQGVLFVVAHVEIDYKSPARYQDTINIASRVDAVGRCSIDFAQEAVRGDNVLVQAKITVVCINKDIKPMALPESVLDKISK